MFLWRIGVIFKGKLKEIIKDLIEIEELRN